VAQVQIQPEAVQHLGHKHLAPEEGRVWDMEVDNHRGFDTGFGNLADDMRGIYGLDYAPSTSDTDTSASGEALGQ
jgi:hypothetical protein